MLLFVFMLCDIYRDLIIGLIMYNSHLLRNDCFFINLMELRKQIHGRLIYVIHVYMITPIDILYSLIENRDSAPLHYLCLVFYFFDHEA